MNQLENFKPKCKLYWSTGLCEKTLGFCQRLSRTSSWSRSSGHSASRSVTPDWPKLGLLWQLCFEQIRGIYERCKENDGGELASYIPQLTRDAKKSKRAATLLSCENTLPQLLCVSKCFLNFHPIFPYTYFSRQQGGPSGHGTQFVDNKLKFPPRY